MRDQIDVGGGGGCAPSRCVTTHTFLSGEFDATHSHAAANDSGASLAIPLIEGHNLSISSSVKMSSVRMPYRAAARVEGGEEPHPGTFGHGSRLFTMFDYHSHGRIEYAMALGYLLLLSEEHAKPGGPGRGSTRAHVGATLLPTTRTVQGRGGEGGGGAGGGGAGGGGGSGRPGMSVALTMTPVAPSVLRATSGAWVVGGLCVTSE